MGEPRARTAPGDVWPEREVHLEWGVPGLEQAAARGDGVVIVDVLSFSTLVALVTERDAVVAPLAPDDVERLGGPDAVAARFDAHVAGATRGDTAARVTLSPSTAARVQAGDRLVVPSPNGSLLTSRAARAPFAVVAAIRGAGAAGRFVAAALRLGLVDRVTVVAAGEQWKAEWTGTDRTRFALEDWLGAGAVALASEDCRAQLSSEAWLAARAFDLAHRDLHRVLADSVSGRELVDRGFEADVALAAAADSDIGVPCLRADGFIARLPFTLRPATRDDRGFLFALKRATMREYVEAAFGPWKDGVERRHYGPDLDRIAVVSVEGRDAGMVEARVEDGALYLANIQIAPRFQSQGIGGRIVSLFAAAAHARDRALVLRVLKVNARAQRFYERLGMQMTGELDHHFAMVLPPP